MFEGELQLIDAVHTPDCSHYYIADGCDHRQSTGEPQLSKEFVREGLMEHDFQGLDGQFMPDMPDDFVELVSDRYIDLYQRITG